MTDIRETGRPEPRPRDAELDAIIRLNKLFYDIALIGRSWSRRSKIETATREQSKTVLDVLQMGELSRISVLRNEDSVELRWQSPRTDEPDIETRRYKFTDLEGALVQDLRMREAGKKAYERDEASDDLGTSGAHFFELFKHKRMKRIGLAIQMHRWGMLSRIGLERARGKVRLWVPSDNPHFEQTDIEVKLRDLPPEVRKLVPLMPPPQLSGQ